MPQPTSRDHAAPHRSTSDASPGGDTLCTRFASWAACSIAVNVCRDGCPCFAYSAGFSACAPSMQEQEDHAQDFPCLPLRQPAIEPRKDHPRQQHVERGKQNRRHRCPSRQLRPRPHHARRRSRRGRTLRGSTMHRTGRRPDNPARTSRSSPESGAASVRSTGS